MAYILIEVLEVYSAKNIQQNRLLTGKYSNLFASSFGLIPQCGFSVVATDLYTHKKIKIGALLAVYIATSDEAVPLLLTSTDNPNKMLALIPLLAIKFMLAIAVGYMADLVIKRKSCKNISFETDKTCSLKDSNLVLTASQNDTAKEIDNEATISEDKTHKHHHDEHDEDESLTEHHHGCCGHDIEGEKVNPWKQFLLHPIIHSLKIFAFILAVNFVMGIIIGLIGEESLADALTVGKWFTPLIAGLIGAIPNCASSVVITRLYILGSIGFGALTAGLIVNAGLGFVILFKQNKNLKQNFALLGFMLALGIFVGYIIQVIGF